MLIVGEPKISLRSEAKDFIDLYASVGERAENFLPKQLLDSLRNFVQLCYDEPVDPAKQKDEIDRYILELKESIPGYTDVSMMLFPHENSKAYLYTSKKQNFTNKLSTFIEQDKIEDELRKQTSNVLNFHDFSIGTPPVTQETIDLMCNLVLGDSVRDLRKFRDVIGVIGDQEEAHWHYFMDILDQMIIQSTHYTTKGEKNDFLMRTRSTLSFKGLNGFIRTVVSGSAQTAIKLLKGEVFNADHVVVCDNMDAEDLFQRIKEDHMSIFLWIVPHFRKNVFNDLKWFPYLTRIVIIDDSVESNSSNTSMVFTFHNQIINILNKVHTKKLGALANNQLNLRLTLEKVNKDYLVRFRELIENKIQHFEEELKALKMDQLGETDNLEKNTTLYKLNEFAKQIIRDKHAIEKLRDFLFFLENTRVPEQHHRQNAELIKEFEERTKQYFYSDNDKLNIATVVEGGGRNQIKTYADWLLVRNLKLIDDKIIERCKTIINIIPNNFKRTLHNHFHKNFGLNLFLEKYKSFITKIDNEADNKGRFRNILLDLGILDEYLKLDDAGQNIIKEFISAMAGMEQTSISDDVQMIIRDLLFNPNANPKPYVIFIQQLAWEYRDLFPDDQFDINPFNIEIDNTAEGRIDFEKMLARFQRIKNVLALFDPSGNLWDRFCENTTVLINDPSNPTGFSDFNKESVKTFLKFLSTSKITLFLDEAYNDGVKLLNDEFPKWRSFSRYIMNNIDAFPKIHVVSSLSTTKNLGATGDRLGSLVSTPARKDFVSFAKSNNTEHCANSNSLYMLNCTLQTAQLAKKIKEKMETNLPKDASRQKIKENLMGFIKDEIGKDKSRKASKILSKSMANFEGSPIHIYMLEELNSLDKLDVLGLPDDFKYKDEPFFFYYLDHLVKGLNKFRINRIFRNESVKRLNIAKEIAARFIAQENILDVDVVDSDGSYLFNLQLKSFSSYQDLEKFTKKLAEQRGIAAIPYKTGNIRFSLGGYLQGNDESYDLFKKEIETGLAIFLKHWNVFYRLRSDKKNIEIETDVLLANMFKTSNDIAFLVNVLDDYSLVKNFSKKMIKSLKISDIKTLYHAFPKVSGINIHTIRESENSVIEMYGNLGGCRTVSEFINSVAFTKVYENLLPQIYTKMTKLRKLDFHEVVGKYGKANILKYIENKKSYKPNDYVLDNPDELNTMKEILIEMEKLLFSDAKTKILTLPATDDINGDQAKLEGVNMILRKHIQELLIHFNLPFEKDASNPSYKELIEMACVRFEETIGKSVKDLGLKSYIEAFVATIRSRDTFAQSSLFPLLLNPLFNVFSEQIISAKIEQSDKLLRIFLLKQNDSMIKGLESFLKSAEDQIHKLDDDEAEMFVQKFILGSSNHQIKELFEQIFQHENFRITNEQLHSETRTVVVYLVDMLNRTFSTDYYDKYINTLIKLTEVEFRKQNSSINEMVQHGITIYKDFEMKNKVLEEYNGGALNWVNDVMRKCGVIASEQPVQTHTRIATDAKKREYPIYKVDRDEVTPKISLDELEKGLKSGKYAQHEYIKHLDVKPSAEFFNSRISNFVQHMDPEDYRCKIVKQGLVKELVIFQKCYMKYLTDNYRLFLYDDVSLEDIQNFVPDVIAFFGAPEKVVSYPQISFFEMDGPNGKIRTIVTPLKKEADYFGNIKKPRLTMINERIKEMGGIPIHGSLFAIEEEDGSIFVVEVNGDSGAGKSEMLAALVLRWLKKTVPGVRSIKFIAGDMFHLFTDDEGNLYGVGTEVGDFSRVTDFDPDFIKYYKYLFESSADSNVENLNSRSTVSGLCDITMPFKIDIMLTASNYSRSEAGVVRVDNPENFLFYIDAHGERKEKATSEDKPNFARTLLRYTDEPNILELISKHGNYLDEILDWELDKNGKWYLCSSYKMMDKIDIEGLVFKMFDGKKLKENNHEYLLTSVKFDIIKNRFIAHAHNAEGEPIVFQITRNFFGQYYDSLASTPAGHPFIAEKGQNEGKQHLLNILRGGIDGKGKGKNIQCGVLSTDLGKKGKEITGPQKAAEELKDMIRSVRILNPEINKRKQLVKQMINEKYYHIFKGTMESPELWRYNFYLYQVEQMRKAKFVRVDNPEIEVSFKDIKGFIPKAKHEDFSPLLVTPNANIELNSFGETYDQLMSLPNNPELAEYFSENVDKLYEATGYSEATKVNNMVVQLLLINGYIDAFDCAKGRITEKVNRETIAAAKFSVIEYLKKKSF